VSGKLRDANGSAAYIEYALRSFDGEDLWLAAVSEAILEEWRVPYAFRLGVVQGYAVVDVSVNVRGIIDEVSTVDCAGHEMLRKASVACLDSVRAGIRLPILNPPTPVEIRLAFQYPERDRVGVFVR
jgi:hypothetical protein